MLWHVLGARCSRTDIHQYHELGRMCTFYLELRFEMISIEHTMN